MSWLDLEKGKVLATALAAFAIAYVFGSQQLNHLSAQVGGRNDYCYFMRGLVCGGNCETLHGVRRSCLYVPDEGECRCKPTVEYSCYSNIATCSAEGKLCPAVMHECRHVYGQCQCVPKLNRSSSSSSTSTSFSQRTSPPRQSSSVRSLPLPVSSAPRPTSCGGMNTRSCSNGTRFCEEGEVCGLQDGECKCIYRGTCSDMRHPFACNAGNYLCQTGYECVAGSTKCECRRRGTSFLSFITEPFTRLVNFFFGSSTEDTVVVDEPSQDLKASPPEGDPSDRVTRNMQPITAPKWCCYENAPFVEGLCTPQYESQADGPCFDSYDACGRSCAGSNPRNTTWFCGSEIDGCFQDNAGTREDPNGSGDGEGRPYVSRADCQANCESVQWWCCKDGWTPPSRVCDGRSRDYTGVDGWKCFQDADQCMTSCTPGAGGSTTVNPAIGLSTRVITNIPQGPTKLFAGGFSIAVRCTNYGANFVLAVGSADFVSAAETLNKEVRFDPDLDTSLTSGDPAPDGYCDTETDDEDEEEEEEEEIPVEPPSPPPSCFEGCVSRNHNYKCSGGEDALFGPNAYRMRDAYGVCPGYPNYDSCGGYGSSMIPACCCPQPGTESDEEPRGQYDPDNNPPDIPPPDLPPVDPPQDDPPIPPPDDPPADPPSTDPPIVIPPPDDPPPVDPPIPDPESCAGSAPQCGGECIHETHRCVPMGDGCMCMETIEPVDPPIQPASFSTPVDSGLPPVEITGTSLKDAHRKIERNPDYTQDKLDEKCAEAAERNPKLKGSRGSMDCTVLEMTREMVRIRCEFGCEIPQ